MKGVKGEAVISYADRLTTREMRHCRLSRRVNKGVNKEWFLNPHHKSDSLKGTACPRKPGFVIGYLCPSRVVYATLGLVVVILLSACAPRKIHYPPAVATSFPQDDSEGGAEASWWACRFKISWPPGAEPHLAVDVLLAHAVVRPVLRKHGKELSWWRFHRRAVRDKIGHQFSFLFYSDSIVSADIMEDIRQSNILQQALADKIVEKIAFDDPHKPTRPGIEATSDGRWSPELQRNWPSYIMGVSSLWLGLIDDIMEDVPAHDDNVPKLLEEYRQAEAAVTAVWHREGQHAFLHHLNAIFGYEPLMIIKGMRF